MFRPHKMCLYHARIHFSFKHIVHIVVLLLLYLTWTRYIIGIAVAIRIYVCVYVYMCLYVCMFVTWHRNKFATRLSPNIATVPN